MPERKLHITPESTSGITPYGELHRLLESLFIAQQAVTDWSAVEAWDASITREVIEEQLAAAREAVVDGKRAIAEMCERLCPHRPAHLKARRLAHAKLEMLSAFADLEASEIEDE